MKQKAVLTIALFFSLVSVLKAQNFDENFGESSRLVDLPTAYTLHKANFLIDMRMYAGGGLLGSAAFGISDRVMLGMSYGGDNMIGEGNIGWNPQPGIEARLRVLDETFRTPALTVGFDSQGFGAFRDTYRRYETKSRGMFVAVSKNYALFRNSGLHGGVNWSLEGKGKDKEVNAFLGADVLLNPEFRVFVEYDFAINDNENNNEFGSGRGYLNGGVRWIFERGLYAQFNFKNLFSNGPSLIRREFKIGYVEAF